ncbi:lipoprotein N-acyltransferase Lnb [Phocaeicola sp.]
MNKLIIILALLLSFGMQPLNAQQDSVKVSLLTCAPGTEIYALFGHTALRYEDPAHGQDIVFNYGIFDFNTPNFIFRFVKGETDYKLGVAPYESFEWQYAMRGSSVYQQTLNLTSAEKQKLWDLLEENYRPENRVYRYNFFYDNCTTRARDRFEECIDGKVTYPEGKEGLSFRDIVHQYTKGHEWDELGIDMCLGSEADVPIDARKQMFAPFYLLEAAKKATIMEGDSLKPLVLAEKKIVDVEPEEEETGFPLSPMACVVILMGVTCLIGWLQLRVKKVIWIWDILLFGAQGLAGCVIAFLVFFSIHPTVGSNWLIILFNPIPLIYLPIMVYRAIKGKKDLYHVINVVYLTLFIMIMPFVGQKFNATVLPLALCLLICSACHVLLYYRRNNK